jgi:hypothetical protein
MHTEQDFRVERGNNAIAREILAPALNAGIRLQTSLGASVTLENLPAKVLRGSKIQMIDEGGRLAAITLSDEQMPDTVRQHEFVASFEQTRRDGRRDRFYLIPCDMRAVAIAGYRPAMLDLSSPIDAIRWTDAKRIHRVPTNRAERIFRHLMATS